jgi:UDP-galactopyranose mutase
MKILIVGAGLSGATLARCFADDGHNITIIEKRNHIAGNVYDYKNKDGLLIGKYGAHIFHTSYEDVWKFVNKYSKWNKYEHRVLSKVDGKLVPIPINIDTVNTLLGLSITSEEEMKLWLKKQGAGKIKNPKNSEESALNRIGNEELYSKMIKNYTKKQWDMYPNELEPSVLDRIPVRTNNYDRYFSDTYEAMPKEGYTKFVENILNHKNIKVVLETDYFEFKDKNNFDYEFFTGKIDQYFNEKYGKLQYRSLRFEHEIHDTESYQEAAVVNYPQEDVDFTRIVEHKKLYGQDNEKTLITKEYSKADGEAYYPIPNSTNRKIYQKYQKEASESAENVCFVGRLANYKYFNMDQAIKNALDIYNNMKGELK